MNPTVSPPDRPSARKRSGTEQSVASAATSKRPFSRRLMTASPASPPSIRPGTPDRPAHGVAQGHADGQPQHENGERLGTSARREEVADQGRRGGRARRLAHAHAQTENKELPEISRPPRSDRREAPDEHPG